MKIDKTCKTTEVYYAVREGCQPFYNVRIKHDDNSRKIMKYLSKHPEALSRTVVLIYWVCSGDERCELKMYDTVDECTKAIVGAREAEKESRFATSYERIVKIIKRKRTVIEEEVTIADNQISV